MNRDKFSLPVSDVIPEITNHFNIENTLIVSAPPGAGKSTLLPICLMGEGWLGNQKILMLEPRRLAAKSIAVRMSQMLGETVGQRIGYRIKHEKKVSENTRIEVITEGMLIRMLQKDNMLDGVGMIIFDEFHERNLFSDISLALCREVQDVLRPDLRILMMSATLDLSALSGLLKCPVIESRGRMYPVDIRYSDFLNDTELISQVVSTVSKALTEEFGDILVFLPGEGEIKKCEERLLRICPEEVIITPLYGQLSFDKQQKAIVPDELGRRKVVLSTSIAETSLTIQGIRIVIDSGYYRSQQFNPSTEMSRLQTLSISKDMADQRAGRAGRTQDGICFRLWTKATHERMADHRTAEILQADLSSLMLEMAMWGVSDIRSLSWLTLPPVYAINRAEKSLEGFGAIEDGRITHYGKKMHALACHPRMAHMLLSAEQVGQVSLAADIAALLEERDPMLNETPGSDLLLRVHKLRQIRKSSSPYSPLWQRILKSSQTYCTLLNVRPESVWIENRAVGFLLSRAFPERIAKSAGRGIFQLANGQRARMSDSDDLAHEDWLCIAHLDDRSGIGQIFLAASVNEEDLLPETKKTDVVCWETRNGGLIARREWKIGQILLKSKPLQKVPEVLVSDVLTDIIRVEGKNLLDFNEAVEQWQARILSLKQWDDDTEWPDVTTEALLASSQEWLGLYLINIRKNEDLKRIDLKEILHYNLPYELQLKLEEYAPEKIQVPSGSLIRLTYFPDGSQPVLAVRLQECFGLIDTPKVYNERIPVLMHLLSPGFKPVQITSDLSSFWKNTYFDVRKDLKRRYPKHAWPDDPINETPLRGVKSKKP